MSCKYQEAKQGYRFEPTEKADERIRDKFKTKHPKSTYFYKVPIKWVENGLVKEVEDGKE